MAIKLFYAFNILDSTWYYGYTSHIHIHTHIATVQATL